MNKVLITGGAGFIGLSLARKLLEKGYKVDLVDNFSRAVKDDDLKEIEKNENISLKEINLLEASQVSTLSKDYFSIFHLAAIIGVQHVLNNPFLVLKDNIAMLLNIIDLACKQNDNFSRLLFASTSEVYAGTLKEFDMKIPTPESTPLATGEISDARSSYMLSKIYGEALCHHSKLPITLFRPHNIYGPRMGMSHVIPEQFYNIYKSKENDEIDVCSVNHTRSFCYIDDAVEMLYLIMINKKCLGKTLNIGTQKSEITIQKLVEFCIKITRKEITINPINKNTGSPHRRCPDMTETIDLINFESAIGLEEGLNKTYLWYRDNIFSKRKSGAV